jgi:hypothetical protein
MKLLGFKTTVTKHYGGNEIAVDDAAGLEPGDEIIIEDVNIKYGQPGIDGAWPVFGTHYYAKVPIGRSWMGTITRVQGKDITLDRPIVAQCVGLPMHRDNTQPVVAAIENRAVWPEGGQYALSCRKAAFVNAYLDDSEQVIDFNHSVFFAPMGVPAINFNVHRLYKLAIVDKRSWPDNKHYKNFTIIGNARRDGYGVQSGQKMPEAFYLNGRNCSVDNYTSIDNWCAIACDWAQDFSVSNCKALATEHQYQYISWEFQASSATRGVFHNCEYASQFSRPAFEPFKSVGITFYNCRARNGTFATNESGGTLFKKCSVEWDEDFSKSPTPRAVSLDTPLLQITHNIQYTPRAGIFSGNGIVDFKIDYKQLPAPKRILKSIVVNYSPNPQPVVIRGVDFTCPDPTATYGGSGNIGWLVSSAETQIDVAGLRYTPLNESFPYAVNYKERIAG